MLQICNIVRLFQTLQNDTLCRETTRQHKKYLQIVSLIMKNTWAAAKVVLFNVGSSVYISYN
jgi:hypothetical protein